MLVEIRINDIFCSVGAKLNIRHGADVLHLRSKSDYYMFVLPTYDPYGVCYKDVGTR